MIKRDLHLDSDQLAWMAGLMEGEGTFTKATPAMPRRPRAAICMTDRDIIERVCDLWGTRLYANTVNDDRYKPVFRTELVGGSAVALMALLRPHMSQRRQGQIDAAVASYRPLRMIRHKRFHLLPADGHAFERHWLAGLMEGEGSFGLNPTAKIRISPNVEVNSVDHDVILRVQGIYRGRYGAAVNIHVRPPRHAGYQAQYHLAIVGDAARALMADIGPLLGGRRRARIDELLGGWAQPGRLREGRACYDMRRAA